MSARQYAGSSGHHQPDRPSHEVVMEDPNLAYGVFHHEGHDPPRATPVYTPDSSPERERPSRRADDPTAWHHLEPYRAPHSAPLLSNHTYIAADRPSFGPLTGTSSEFHSPLVANASPPARGEAKLYAGGHAMDRSANTSEQSVFDMAHASKKRDVANKPHVHDIGEQMPIRLGHLFKRPIIRQWLYKGQLYKERDERAPARFELFFDLVFVGVIHILADETLESVHSWNIIKFILVFFPAWSIWCDVRDYLNVSGSDDVFQRIYLLGIMLLLTGYAANATAIVIEQDEPVEAEPITAGGEAAPHVIEGVPAAAGGEGGTGGVTEEGIHRRVVDTLVRRVVPAIIARNSEAAEPAMGKLELVEPIVGTGYSFAEGYQQALRAAVIFYLIAKLCRLLLYFYYGAVLPRFRKALWVNGFLLVIVALIYAPLVYVTTPSEVFLFLVTGMMVELLKPYLVAIVLQFVHGRSKKAGNHQFIPALSLEHLSERCTLFVVLVTGETIINSSYTARGNQIGVHDEYWRAALGITCSFNIIWLYFDSDASRTFVHALRRHWVHSATWTHLHFPLCAALVLLSASLHKMVEAKILQHSYMWIYGGSLAVIMVCLGFLGMLHSSLDRHKSALVPHWWRVTQRFFLAGALGSLPIYQGWTTTGFLGTCAGLLTLQTATETFGKIGALGRYYDEERAAELRQRRAAHQDAVKSGDSSVIEMGSPGSSSMKHSNSASTLNAGKRKFDKHYEVRGPNKRNSWHEWADLTGEERGEEDVGVESEIGKLETRYVDAAQRFAYAAT